MLEVDPKEKTVALRRYAWTSRRSGVARPLRRKEKEKPLNEWEVAARWTFEEFCALNLEEIYIDALDPEYKD